MISKSVDDYGDRDPGPPTGSCTEKEGKAADSLRVDQIVVLAWTTSGSKKVRKAPFTPVPET